MDNNLSSFIQIKMPTTVFEDKNKATQSLLEQLYLSAPEKFTKVTVDVVRGYHLEAQTPIADMIQIKIKYTTVDGQIVQAIPSPEFTTVINFVVDKMQDEVKQSLLSQGKESSDAVILSSIKHLVISLDKEKHFSIGDIEYLRNS